MVCAASATAIVFLLINPYQLFDSGFQMSFAAPIQWVLPCPMSKSYPELIESIKEWFAGYTKDEIADIFVKGDIPFSVAYNWDEIMNDPQANAIGAFYDCEMANGVVKKVTHTPVRLASEMDLPTRRAPWIGENTEEVLKDLGYSDDEIKAMFESGAAYTWDPSVELGDMKPVN